MKIVTQDKASELTVMLLQNDKKIKDELIQKSDDLKSEMTESINEKITKVNSDVDNRFQQVDEKIDSIGIGTMPTISINDIEKLFK